MKSILLLDWTPTSNIPETYSRINKKETREAGNWKEQMGDFLLGFYLYEFLFVFTSIY